MNPTITMNIINFYKIVRMVRDSMSGLDKVQKIKSLDIYYEQYDAHSLGIKNSSALDIGCGPSPKNPFHATNIFGIDVRENLDKGIKCADLAIDPIPFEDSSFDFITAYDFLEHVPRIIYLPSRRLPFVELMNEIWRTLKPNGIFLSHTPIYPYSSVFQDPTHVNFLTHETFPRYFDNEFQLERYTVLQVLSKCFIKS